MTLARVRRERMGHIEQFVCVCVCVYLYAYLLDYEYVLLNLLDFRSGKKYLNSSKVIGKPSYGNRHCRSKHFNYGSQTGRGLSSINRDSDKGKGVACLF